MPQFISGVHVSHHTPLMAILIKVAMFLFPGSSAPVKCQVQ